MAKKAYVGVDNIARKVKNGYVGVRTAFPIYQTQTTTENVTINSDALLSKYFTVTNSGYGFAWNTTYSQFRSLNGGKKGTAQVTLTALQDCTVTYTYNYGTEDKYDKFTLTVKGSTIHSAVSGVGTAKTRTDTLTKGQTIVFTYSKDGSVDKNGDYVAFYNMSATITTTKEVQVGTDYRNVARKIKKAYIGIGGVARPCWSSDELVYYGTITPLNTTRSGFAASSTGDYALFGGGSLWNTGKGKMTYYKTVNAYNKSLVKCSAPDLSEARGAIAGRVSSYALFAGGRDNGSYGCNSVDAYDNSLVHYTPEDLSRLAWSQTSASTKSYALFAAGVSSGLGSSGLDYESNIDAYDSSLTKTALSETLAQQGVGIASTSLGDKAIFAGGGWSTTNYNMHTDRVTVIDDSLTVVSPENLPSPRENSTAMSVGEYALIVGGRGGTSTSSGDKNLDEVVVYDSSLTRSLLSPMPFAVESGHATTLKGFALLGATSPTIGVFAFDASLTMTVLSPSIELGVGTTVGGYALFASTSEVHAYTII